MHKKRRKSSEKDTKKIATSFFAKYYAHETIVELSFNEMYQNTSNIVLYFIYLTNDLMFNLFFVGADICTA